MSKEAIFTSGIILLTIPTIEFGGVFLLSVLTGLYKRPFTPMQKGFFRAGHAHAGVLVILALVVQILADAAALDGSTQWFVRGGAVLAPILISAGFFFAPLSGDGTKPNRLIVLIYIGAALLALVLIVLGISLISVGRA
jgi:hypothetical protein